MPEVELSEVVVAPQSDRCLEGGSSLLRVLVHERFAAVDEVPEGTIGELGRYPIEGLLRSDEKCPAALRILVGDPLDAGKPVRVFQEELALLVVEAGHHRSMPSVVTFMENEPAHDQRVALL